ncbi:MAG: sialate O-acetylesterase [Roseibacillus sp.]
MSMSYRFPFLRAFSVVASLGIMTFPCDVRGEASLPDPDGKSADVSKPVQVFIIMGQSNTLEFGKVKGDKEGSLEHAVKKENLYPFMVDDAGNWTTRKDVRNLHVMGSGGPGKTSVRRNDWLTVSGGKIGIETGIGHHLGNALDAPVLILKSSIGNRSLGWDLLPPGSPRHEVETTNRKTGEKITMVTPAHKDEVRHPSWIKGEIPAPPKHTWHAGLQYLGDVARAKEVLSKVPEYYPGAPVLSGLPGYEVAGFLWWQGDKDRYNAAHAAMYGKNLAQLFKALRKEFGAPNAKMVVATLGQTNKESAQGNEKLILDGMFAFGDDHKGEAAIVYTHPLSMGGASNGHYGGNAKTYMNVGLAMGKAMVDLLKD